MGIRAKYNLTEEVSYGNFLELSLHFSFLKSLNLIKFSRFIRYVPPGMGQNQYTLEGQVKD